MDISLQAVGRCLGLAATFSVRNDLLGWIPAPGHFSLRQQLLGIQCYRIEGVPDVDQRWDPLPNNGKMYCVPASSMNWFYFLGIPPDPGNDGDRVLNLFHLGQLMETDSVDGTTFGDGIDGVAQRLASYGMPAIVVGETVSDGFYFVFADFWAWVGLKAFINFSIGRYKKDGDGEFERTGGHRVTLVGLHQAGQRCEILLHDPADDSQELYTQSAVRIQRQIVTEQHINLEGDGVWLLRWDEKTNPYRFVDGLVAIVPSFAVTDVNPGSVTLYQMSLGGTGVESRSFRLPFEGPIVDLAIHPLLPRVAILGTDGETVWTLDLSNGTWTAAATQGNATLLCFGGRSVKLFVANVQSIVALTGEGVAVAETATSDPIDAMTFDARTNALAVALLGASKLRRYSPALELDRDQPLLNAPADPDDRLLLATDPIDGSVLVVRQGHVDSRVTRSDSPSTAVDLLRLAGRVMAIGSSKQRRSSYYAAHDGKITVYDDQGAPASDAPFSGLGVGSLLGLARSHHNADPQRHSLPRWRDGAST